MNGFGRIPLCGMISLYNLDDPPPGPRNMASMLVSRVTMRGFIVTDHYDLYPRFVEEIASYVNSGEMKYRETVIDGIERMPEAFMGLLRGENIGKMLVKTGPDAT